MKLTPEMITEQYDPEVYQKALPDLVIHEKIVDAWILDNKNLLKKTHVAHTHMMVATGKEVEEFDVFCVRAYYFMKANEAVEEMVAKEINEMLVGA